MERSKSLLVFLHLSLWGDFQLLLVDTEISQILEICPVTNMKCLVRHQVSCDRTSVPVERFSLYFCSDNFKSWIFHHFSSQ